MVTDLRYVLIIAVVFLLVYRQYAKIRDYERRAFNLDRLNPFLETVTALVYGIGGGLVATAFFCHLGNFNQRCGYRLFVACGPGINAD